MNSQALEIFEEQLIDAKDLGDCKKALTEFLLHFGLKTFSFTYYTYHPLSAKKLKYDVQIII